MRSPHPPRPPYPPRPAAGREESDVVLLAGLRGDATRARGLALLLARHWSAVHDYALICLAASPSSPSSSHPASMVATAAFHREFGRADDGALRPRLLAAVRDTVKEWAADADISAMLPELRKTTGGRGLLAARSATPQRRQLAERAFQTLPGASQCLLWHAEVEADPISVPAGLLGVDDGTASAALERAREQLRTSCVRAHRELAPTGECRLYNRLLDGPIRRGGGLLPDVRRHLTVCRYCRYAAEQLSHFADGLDVLLAETVLGWGARRYLDSRPGRATPGNRPATPGNRPATGATAPPRKGGRHRPAPTAPPVAPRRHTKAVVLGTGLLSLALLATVLAVRGWSDEGGEPGPDATWGAQSGNAVHPSAADGWSDTRRPSAATAGHPAEVGRGRLRNPGTGLCLDIDRGRVRDGAAAVLAECSSAKTQQWSYRDDGLLRSAADLTLCLGSDPSKGSAVGPSTRSAVDRGEGAVVLTGCLAHAGEVRYDLTVRGELLLRRGEGLLVAPGSGTRLVVTARDGTPAQRWVLEPAGSGTGPDAEEDGARDSAPRGTGGTEGTEGTRGAEGTEGRDGTGGTDGAGGTGAGRGVEDPGGPNGTRDGAPSSPGAGSPRPTDGPQDRPEEPPRPYETRIAQTGRRGGCEPAGPGTPAGGAGSLPAGAADPAPPDPVTAIAAAALDPLLR